MIGKITSLIEIENCIKSAIKDMTRGSSGYYAPLVKRFPIIYKEDEMPIAALKALKAHKAPACTDGSNVYVDMNEMMNTINMSIEYCEEKNLTDNKTFWVEDEIRNILAHEYTHIICQHSKQGQKYSKKGGKYLKSFMTACEIEANRGYMVGKDRCVYEIAVTEDKFPETKGLKYLQQVYEALLDNYQDDIEEQSPNNSSSDKNDQSEQSSDGDSEGSDSENDMDSQSESKSGSERLSEAQKQAIQRMLETDIDIEEQKMKSSNLLPHDDKSEEGILQQLGLGGEEENEDFENASAVEKMEIIKKKQREQNIKQAMKKMRGVITGNVVGHRTETYSRQSRKQGEDGLIRKGTKITKDKCPKILLAMDSSGSMSSTTMSVVTERIANIFDTVGRPTQGCYICKHDTSVKNIKPMKQWKDVIESYHPYGGNDFLNVMREANKLDVNVVLNVGDGMDYCYGDNDVVDEFVKKGIRWIDVNISNDVGIEQFNSVVDYEKRCHSDHGYNIIEREWLDLTGNTN